LNPQIRLSYHDVLTPKPGEFWQGEIMGQPTYHEDTWETIVRGAGPPPIKTARGWLLFYHAMTRTDYGKYKIGVMLLDLNNPSRIISRARGPLLEPLETYENSGFKPGVVYLSGAVLKSNSLLLYYGASDSYVCVAGCGLDDLLDDLETGSTKDTPETIPETTPDQLTDEEE
jgi:predicted GH43/DUF377 family glycosyl hydrolase